MEYLLYTVLAILGNNTFFIIALCIALFLAKERGNGYLALALGILLRAITFANLWTRGAFNDNTTLLLSYILSLILAIITVVWITNLQRKYEKERENQALQNKEVQVSSFSLMEKCNNEASNNESFVISSHKKSNKAAEESPCKRGYKILTRSSICVIIGLSIICLASIGCNIYEYQLLQDSKHQISLLKKESEEKSSQIYSLKNDLNLTKIQNTQLRDNVEKQQKTITAMSIEASKYEDFVLEAQAAKKISPSDKLFASDQFVVLKKGEAPKIVDITFKLQGTLYLNQTTGLSVVSAMWNEKWSGYTTELIIVPKAEGIASFEVWNDASSDSVVIVVIVIP